MSEQWLPIPDWEGLYAVSDQGRVMSVRRRIIMKTRIDDGYEFVGLSSGGKQKRYAVHRLVLLAFDGECPPGHETRHLNGISTDNRRSNLKWDTHTVNIHDKYEHGTVYQYAKDQCPAGHDYNEANTYIYVNKRGKPERYCRMCRRDRMYRRSTPKKHTTRSGKRLA